MKLQHFIVQSKSDDYGNNIIELVQTTKKNASQYYAHKVVLEEHVEILKKYIYLVEFEEENTRRGEQRYYGR